VRDLRPRLEPSLDGTIRQLRRHRGAGLRRAGGACPGGKRPRRAAAIGYSAPAHSRGRDRLGAIEGIPTFCLKARVTDVWLIWAISLDTRDKSAQKKRCGKRRRVARMAHGGRMIIERRGT